MNIEEVRDYALSLSEVTEDQPFGEDIITFRIGGKIFGCLWLGGGRHDMKDGAPRIALKLTPDRNLELRESHDEITPAWHWNKKHWSDVYYERLGAQMVRDLMKESYELVRGKLSRGSGRG